MTAKARDCDHLLKMVMFGYRGVGKTSLLFRYVEDNFPPNTSKTVQIAFKIRNITVFGKHVKLQIWEAAFPSRRDFDKETYYSHFRGCGAILLLFDLTSRKSFENLSQWITHMTRHVTEDCLIALVGTKFDLKENRAVSLTEALAFATKHNLFQYFETSAKTNYNIEETLKCLAEAVLGKDPQIQQQAPLIDCEHILRQSMCLSLALHRTLSFLTCEQSLISSVAIDQMQFELSRFESSQQCIEFLQSFSVINLSVKAPNSIASQLLSSRVDVFQVTEGKTQFMAEDAWLKLADCGAMGMPILHLAIHLDLSNSVALIHQIATKPSLLPKPIQGSDKSYEVNLSSAGAIVRNDIKMLKALMASNTHETITWKGLETEFYGKLVILLNGLEICELLSDYGLLKRVSLDTAFMLGRTDIIMSLSKKTIDDDDLPSLVKLALKHAQCDIYDRLLSTEHRNKLLSKTCFYDSICYLTYWSKFDLIEKAVELYMAQSTATPIGIRPLFNSPLVLDIGPENPVWISLVHALFNAILFPRRQYPKVLTSKITLETVIASFLRLIRSSRALTAEKWTELLKNEERKSLDRIGEMFESHQLANSTIIERIRCCITILRALCFEPTVSKIGATPELDLELLEKFQVLSCPKEGWMQTLSSGTGTMVKNGRLCKYWSGTDLLYAFESDSTVNARWDEAGNTFLDVNTGCQFRNNLRDFAGLKTFSMQYQLVYLDLSHRSLRDFPMELCSIISLRTLLIAHNLLTVLPEDLANLNALTTLDLSNNSLMSLNSNFGALTALEHLSLSQNKSLTSLPESLQNCRHIKTFLIDGCPVYDQLAVELVEGKTGLGLLEAVLLGNQEARRMFRCKVMLAGDGEAGKTSLRYALSTPPTRVEARIGGPFFTSFVAVLVGKQLSLMKGHGSSKVSNSLTLDVANCTMKQLNANLLTLLHQKKELVMKFKDQSTALRWYNALQFIAKPDRTVGAIVEYIPLERSVADFKHLRDDFVNQRASKVENLELTLWDLGGQEEYWFGHRLYLQRRCIYVVMWDVINDKNAVRLHDWLLRIAGTLCNQEHSHADRTKVVSAVFVVANKCEEKEELEQVQLLSKAKLIVSGIFDGKDNGIIFQYLATSLHSFKPFGVNRLIDQIFQVAAVMNHMGEMGPWWLRQCEEAASILRTEDAPLFIESEDFLNKANTIAGREISLELLVRALEPLQAWSKIMHFAILPHLIVVDPTKVARDTIGPLLQQKMTNTDKRSGGLFTVDVLEEIFKLSAERFQQVLTLLLNFHLLIPVEARTESHSVKKFLSPVCLSVSIELSPSPHAKYVHGTRIHMRRTSGGVQHPYLPRDLPARIFAAMCILPLKVKSLPIAAISESQMSLQTSLHGCCLFLLLDKEHSTLDVVMESQRNLFNEAASMELLDLVISTIFKVSSSDYILELRFSEICGVCLSISPHDCFPIAIDDDCDQNMTVTCPSCHFGLQATEVRDNRMWWLHDEQRAVKCENGYVIIKSPRNRKPVADESTLLVENDVKLNRLDQTFVIVNEMQRELINLRKLVAGGAEAVLNAIEHTHGELNVNTGLAQLQAETNALSDDVMAIAANFRVMDEGARQSDV